MTVATDIEWLWGECVYGIKCPCGQENILDDEGDDVRCECGRLYRLVCYVDILEDGDDS